jgi:methionyl-tRNA formyltransferase
LAVVTGPDKVAGRGHQLIQTPVRREAEKRDIPVLMPTSLKGEGLYESLRRLEAELFVVVAFRILPERLFSLPEFGAINLHASLLPKYRGAAPINWAIINGELRTGITAIELNERWDAGAILGQAATGIQATETAGQLHDRLAAMGPALLDEVLAQIAQGTSRPLPQEESRASRAPKLKKADGAIRWSDSARQVYNRVRGLWPWPGAFCFLDVPGRPPERLIVAQAAVADERNPQVPATHELGRLDADMTIICGSGRLRLLEVKPENAKLMSFAAYANGRHLRAGDLFRDGAE